LTDKLDTEKKEVSLIDISAGGRKKSYIFSLIGIFIPIIVSIVIYVLQTRNMELSFEMSSFSEIVKMVDGLENMKLTYRGKRVDRLGIISLRITNSGNTPIKKEDFERPLRLVFKERPEVFIPKISRVFPVILSPHINVVDKYVQIEPLLLNPGDNFTLDIITSAKSFGLTIDARIAGLKAPVLACKPSMAGKERRNIVLYFGIIIASLLYAFLVFYTGVVKGSVRKLPCGLFSPRPVTRIEAIVVTLLAACLGPLILIVGLDDVITGPMDVLKLTGLLVVLPIFGVAFYQLFRRWRIRVCCKKHENCPETETCTKM
jgi:hypothetical protein